MANSKQRTSFNYWDRHYKPIMDDFGDSMVMYDHSDPEDWLLIQQAHAEHRLWTVVTEGNTWDIVSGMAFVNRMYYIITEVPHNVDKFEIVVKF